MPFDRDNFIKNLKQFAPGLSDEQISRQADMHETKQSFLKQGDNVVHLDYLGHVFENEDIKHIESELIRHNIELSRYDHDGIAQMNIEDFTLQIAICLNEPIVQNLLVGMSSSALWDSIKNISLYTWKKVRSQTFTKYSTSSKETRKINVGVRCKYSKDIDFNFKLKGDLSEETTIESLDKILTFLKETAQTNRPEKIDILEFNQNSGDWSHIDVLKEIQKLAKKQNKK